MGSSTQRSVLTDITQRQIPIIRILNTITDGANEQAIQFRNLAIFSTEKIQTSARAMIQKTRTEVAAEMDLLQQHIQSAQGKSLLENLKLRRAAFLKSGDEFLGLIDRGQREEALTLLETQLRPHQLEYQRVIREMLDRQTQNAEVASEKAESAADNLFKEVLATGAIAIVLAVVLAITITRSITRPLSLAVAAADRVAGGDLSGQITVKSQDETGQLLHALQRMQQSLVNTVTAVRSNAQGGFGQRPDRRGQ